MIIVVIRVVHAAVIGRGISHDVVNIDIIIIIIVRVGRGRGKGVHHPHGVVAHAIVIIE